MDSKYFDKHANPYDLNNPKVWDYRKLYDAFFEMQDRLVAAERSLEESRDGYNKQIRELHDKSVKVESRLEEATELVAKAGDQLERWDQGEVFMCGLQLHQPYKHFVLKNLKI